MISMLNVLHSTEFCQYTSDKAARIKSPVDAVEALPGGNFRQGFQCRHQWPLPQRLSVNSHAMSGVSELQTKLCRLQAENRKLHAQLVKERQTSLMARRVHNATVQRLERQAKHAEVRGSRHGGWG